MLRLWPSSLRHLHYVSNEPTLNRRDVQRRFDRAAQSFDSVDFVHAVTREGMFARLEPLVIDTRAILDLGSATGSANPALKKRFGRSHIVSLDLSHSMLRQSKGKRRWFTRSSHVQGDAGSLPFNDQSFDLVFANLLLPWIDGPGRVLSEVCRVLRNDGVFTFATLGPDSLLELSRAWSKVDAHAHVNRFPDMHDIGDALVRAGLRDPVLDVDRLTVRYDDPARLFKDLTRMGARNALLARNQSLVGKRRFKQMVAALNDAADDNGISFDLELVYGHCWGGGVKNNPSDYRIDATQIPRRRT